MVKRRSKPTVPARKKTAGSKPTSAVTPNPARKNTNHPAAKLTSNLFSLENIGNLRTLCKNCLKYLQQADMLLDTLVIASNSLNETGLLKKIMQTKGKGLSTNDLTSLLLAFLNTPLADRFFKGGSGSSSDSAPEEQPENNRTPNTPSHESLPAPQYQSQAPAHPPNFPAWQGYMPGYGPPPNPGSYPPPPPGRNSPGTAQFPKQW